MSIIEATRPEHFEPLFHDPIFLSSINVLLELVFSFTLELPFDSLILLLLNFLFSK